MSEYTHYFRVLTVLFIGFFLICVQPTVTYAEQTNTFQDILQMQFQELDKAIDTVQTQSRLQRRDLNRYSDQVKSIHSSLKTTSEPSKFYSKVLPDIIDEYADATERLMGIRTSVNDDFYDDLEDRASEDPEDVREERRQQLRRRGTEFTFNERFLSGDYRTHMVLNKLLAQHRQIDFFLDFTVEQQLLPYPETRYRHHIWAIREQFSLLLPKFLQNSPTTSSSIDTYKWMIKQAREKNSESSSSEINSSILRNMIRSHGLFLYYHPYPEIQSRNDVQQLVQFLQTQFTELGGRSKSQSQQPF